MRHLRDILNEGRPPKPKGIFVSDDTNEPYPKDTMVYIQKAINKNSKDKSKDWNSAIELVDTSLDELNVPKPLAYMRDRWSQYTEMISYAVKNLADSRGMNGKWNSQT